MKRVRFVTGEFVDYTGTTKKFVMAGVTLSSDQIDNKNVETDAMKVLSVGVAVCNPEDKYDEEFGKKLAEGKASARFDHIIGALDSGMIGTAVVNAVLTQESRYFINDPGRYIAGYNADKKKYLENKRLEEFKASLEGDSKTTFAYLSSLTKKEREAFLSNIK